MTPEFERKRDAALAELDAAGIWRSNAYPPLYRLLHRLGVAIPLSHYQPFMVNLLFQGLWFGSAWGLLMWFTRWSSDGTTLQSALLTAAFAGLFFGLFMAVYCAIQRRRHGLSRWQDL